MNITPELHKECFQCPHCNVVSQQEWFTQSYASEIANRILNNEYYNYRTQISDYEQKVITKFITRIEPANNKYILNYIPSSFAVSTCSSCSEITIWKDSNIVFPRKISVERPNQDMDQEIQDLYLEAALIVGDSPKGATALLRLALQLLLKQIGKSGKNINNDIKELVAQGLSPKIQQALDLLRVVGNNAVHPGQIDLSDDNEIAIKLFHILNFIANEMITKPKELDFLYSSIIPEDTKQHIKERDGT